MCLDETSDNCDETKDLDTPETVAFFFFFFVFFFVFFFLLLFFLPVNLKEKHGGSCRFHNASSVNGKTSNKSRTKTTLRFNVFHSFIINSYICSDTRPSVLVQMRYIITTVCK